MITTATKAKLEKLACHSLRKPLSDQITRHIEVVRLCDVESVVSRLVDVVSDLMVRLEDQDHRCGKCETQQSG